MKLTYVPVYSIDQASGQSSSCMTAQLIEAGEDEEVVKDVAGIMYLG